MMDVFFHVVQALHGLLWGWPVLAVILLMGINLSVRSGFFQLVHARFWMRKTLFSIRKKDAVRENGLSPLQAVSTALAGSIGTGNIVGVASALTIGGAGSLFWMWISAIFGMMTIFAENVLGMKYRVRDASGVWRGGAMYYIAHGLRSPFLAKVFAGACVLASLSMGNLAQANAISQVFSDSFGVSTWITGLLLGGGMLLIAAGGIRRTARVAEKLVPGMAAGYLLVCFLVLFLCQKNLPAAIASIFTQAFDVRAAAGGIGGTLMMRGMQVGISRGIFTNEAGLGSSVMAHASTEGTSPTEQGMWGILQVFIDTIVMCTVTGLCILASGASVSGKDGAALSAEAFRSALGEAGGIFVACAIALFAFATMLAWCCYGESGLRYLGGKGIVGYRVLFAAAAFLSCQMELQLVWDLSDICNGLMAIPNLAAVFWLSGEVLEELQKDLRSREKHRRFRC